MSGAYKLKLIDGEYKKVYLKSGSPYKCPFCWEKLDRRRTNLDHFAGSCVRKIERKESMDWFAKEKAFIYTKK